MAILLNFTSVKNGVGRTTLAAIVAQHLASNNKKILLIDNNYKFSDLEKVLCADPKYSVDDIKPFIQKNTDIDLDAFKLFTCEINDRFYLLAGSRIKNSINILSAEEIYQIKNFIDDEYDYIIIDSRAGLDKKEHYMLYKEKESKTIIVLQASKIEIEELKNQLRNIQQEDEHAYTGLIEESVFVLNRYHEEVDFNTKELLKFNRDIFKLEYEPAIVNYSNGYDTKLKSVNRATISKLLENITNEERQTVQKQTFFKRIFSLG